MTPLPEDLARKAARLLQRRLKEWLEPGENVTVSGEQGDEGAEVVVTLELPGGHRRTETGVRVAVPGGASTPEAALDLAFDAADAFLGQWLEEGRETRHPIEWVELTFDDRPVQVRQRITRPIVEAEADRLLDEDEGEDGDGPAGV